MNKKRFFQIIADFIFRVRRFRDKCIKKFAQGVKNQRILELGSGKKVSGRYYYSLKRFFDESNEFIQSDVVPEYGHTIVDATKMDYVEKYDIILCTNVLEHVYDYQKAVENIHRALKEGGIAVIFVPVFYPFHDEPYDYWRFTEHSLRKLLKMFNQVTIRYNGIREYPFAYYIEAKK